jgi:hypothetical protein
MPAPNCAWHPRTSGNKIMRFGCVAGKNTGRSYSLISAISERILRISRSILWMCHTAIGSGLPCAWAAFLRSMASCRSRISRPSFPLYSCEKDLRTFRTRAGSGERSNDIIAVIHYSEREEICKRMGNVYQVVAAIRQEPGSQRLPGPHLSKRNGQEFPPNCYPMAGTRPSCCSIVITS